MNGLAPVVGNLAALNSSVCISPVHSTSIFGLLPPEVICPVVPIIMAYPWASKLRKAYKIDKYSDASSTYWAPGWNWERWSSADMEFGDTSAEDIEKMRLGILEVLGEEEFEVMTTHLYQMHTEWNDRKMVADGVPPPEYRRPDFLKQWKQWHNGGEVGFVAFRTTLYDNESKWKLYKERMARLLSLSFDKVVRHHRWHEYEEIAEARTKFNLHWVEDKSLEGASAVTLRERYLDMRRKKQLPARMDYSMFLCASPQAVESVLALENEDDFPTTESGYWRSDAPFLLTVMEWESVDPHGPEEPHDPDDPHDERNWYKSVFKVPVEIVYDTLWHIEDSNFIEPTRLMRSVKGSEELGGKMNENFDIDGLQEMWWGMGPTPASLKRRAEMRKGRGSPWGI